MAGKMAKFNFTKTAIDSLPLPEEGWAYHYDLKVHGLGIGVGKTGKKTFILYRKVNGDPQRHTLGRYPDLTIEQARGKASELNAAIANGLNPADIKRGRAAELTFGDLFAQYIERHAKHNKRTWAEDKQRFEQYLQKPLGKKKLSQVNRQLVASIHSEITLAGHPVVANRVLALISSVYGWAISVGLIETNPVQGIKRNREKSRDRFLQSDELPRFFKALAEEENGTMRDYFLLSLLTGARRANVLSMQWADINFERAEWRIKDTKNGTPQTVTLSPEAIDILRNRLPSTPTQFVFPGTGKSGHLEEPKKGWQRILSRAGISDLRIHDLRRTLGSWQAKQGASLAIIGKSLNHKNQNTTAIYARLDLDPVRDSVNTATSAMLAAGQVKEHAHILKFTSKKT
jgi:integrase